MAKKKDSSKSAPAFKHEAYIEGSGSIVDQLMYSKATICLMQ